MKARKDKLLNELSIKLDLEYTRMKSEVLDGRDDAAASSSRRLDHIQKLYDMTKTFPTWPFSNRMLRIFAGTWLAPILIALLVKTIETLIKKII